MNLFGSLLGKLSPGGSVSATFRVAEHEVKITAAKGAIIALKAAEKVANETLGELEGAAEKIHEGRDAIHERIVRLQTSLGF